MLRVRPRATAATAPFWAWPKRAGRSPRAFFPGAAPPLAFPATHANEFAFLAAHWSTAIFSSAPPGRPLAWRRPAFFAGRRARLFFPTTPRAEPFAVRFPHRAWRAGRDRRRAPPRDNAGAA